MFIKVVFKSILGKLCPEEYSVEAKTPSEAIRAVTNQLKDKLIKPNGLRWVCRVKGYETVDSLKSACEEGTVLEVYPDFRASGLFSWVKIVIGAIFIVAGIFFGQPWAVSLGASLVLSGIADLLTPGASNGKEEEASRYFGHRQNTTLIGTRIPIAYGRNKIYGHLLSLNTGTGSNQVEKYVLNVNTSGGKITGVTPTNPNYPYTPDISTDGESATIEVPKDSEVIVEITKPDGTTEDTTIIVDDNKTERLGGFKFSSVSFPDYFKEFSCVFSLGEVFVLYDAYTGEKYKTFTFTRSSEESKEVFSKPNQFTWFAPVSFNLPLYGGTRYMTWYYTYLYRNEQGEFYFPDYPATWTELLTLNDEGPYALSDTAPAEASKDTYAVGYVFFAVKKEFIGSIVNTQEDISMQNIVTKNPGKCFAGTMSPKNLEEVFPSSDYYVSIFYKILYNIGSYLGEVQDPSSLNQPLLMQNQVVSYGSNFSFNDSGDPLWIRFTSIVRSIDVLPCFIRYSDIVSYLDLIKDSPQEQTERLFSSTKTLSSVRCKYSLEDTETVTYNDVFMRVIWSNPDYIRNNLTYVNYPYNYQNNPQLSYDFPDVFVCGTVQVLLLLDKEAPTRFNLVGAMLPTESQEDIRNM